ncbi:MAG: type II pantothenate kinase [Clostridia bacterium]|nr:type II pantothenate kinase [Clostridia bacterium]MBR5366138.1 type II pantothenate kinase [Clostridia bacterium]
MAEHVIIGIDIGGSTTKIVGFDTSRAEKTLIRPILVRATDPITSIYGAFGKFLDQNGLTLGDVKKVMVTGAGSSYMSKPIYGLPSEKIAEFKSIGLGGLYLSGLERAIIASCGTGTALVYAEEGKEPDYLGGTGVGGGTLVGLSKKMLNMDNVDHISELAKSGSLDRVDLKIKDITKSDIIPGFSDIMTASNFGQVSDLATRADIACGIINMVFETIGMISIFAARNYKIRDVVLTGNLSQVAQAESVFATLNRMFDMNFIIPENSAFGTVIGAALAGMNT